MRTKSRQYHRSDLLMQYVQQEDGVKLVVEETDKDGIAHILVLDETNISYRINESARLVWVCCKDPIKVSDLLQKMEKGFPGASSIHIDVLSILEEFQKLGLVKYDRYPYFIKQVALDHQPVRGRRSVKAERLVEFCLGDFSNRQVLPCTGSQQYLNEQKLLLLEAGSKSIKLFSGLKGKRKDTKKVVDAWISQRAAVPAGLKSWLISGDRTGDETKQAQGLHITGMRRKSDRHLVLVPTACRNRYLGPKLDDQMKELRQSWVPWEDKSDTAWWGGALTGDLWKRKEPRPLTRREVVCYFRDHPSDRIRLDLTAVSPNVVPPAGVELKEEFTKKSAFSNKCLLLLPGNDIASGSSWFFAGNSVVLMPRPHLEHILFFEIEPWKHYVPIERDPADILVKLDWVLNNQGEARKIVDNAHKRLRWFCGDEYLWACNEVLRRIAGAGNHSNR